MQAARGEDAEQKPAAKADGQRRQVLGAKSKDVLLAWKHVGPVREGENEAFGCASAGVMQHVDPCLRAREVQVAQCEKS